MFEWINRRLHCINSYSQFSQDKYASDEEDDEMRAAAAAAAEEDADTAALLLHDMLNGILTLGTLSYRHSLISQAYGNSSDPDDDGFYEQGVRGVGVAGAAAFFPAAREKPPSAFRIELTAEEERRIMEVAAGANYEAVTAEKKTLELPLLEKMRPRTTLEELLASTRAEFLAGGDGNAGSEERKAAATVHMRKAEKSDGGEKKTDRGQQKDTLIPKILVDKKRRIHPELVREENAMAAHGASDGVL